MLLLPGLRLTGSYTFLYSFVLKGASASYSFADDKRAIYSPVHKAALALSYEGKRTRLGVDAEYVGERFADEANTTRLAAVPGAQRRGAAGGVRPPEPDPGRARTC